MTKTADENGTVFIVEAAQGNTAVIPQKRSWKIRFCNIQDKPQEVTVNGQVYKDAEFAEDKKLHGTIVILKDVPAEKLEMGYRTSLVKTKGYLVLSAVIVLEQGNQEAIKARMKELTEQRVSKQPLEFPSAGSTFKRPEGYFAGKLIMDAGLRGYQTGGAQVSEKHCGFVINKDNATAADVCRLLRDVQDKVKEQFGVTLEPEVKFLGKF